MLRVTQIRSAGAVAILMAIGACAADQSVAPQVYSITGPVVVTGFLVDAAGVFRGTRVDGAAHGIVVELFHGSALVASTTTIGGTYRFDALKPGGYALRSRIDEVVNDSTKTITLIRSDILVGDTLRLISQGDLYPVPNPAFPTTRIYFDLPDTQHVLVRVLDASGQLVRVLLDGERPPGLNQIPWLGDDSLGVDAPRGLYWLTLHSQRDTRTHALFR